MVNLLNGQTYVVSVQAVNTYFNFRTLFPISQFYFYSFTKINLYEIRWYIYLIFDIVDMDGYSIIA